jgi:hypothetical protein
MISECGPAEGMRAAAEKRDFGTSLGSSVIDYSTFASVRKGLWLFRHGPRPARL